MSVAVPVEAAEHNLKNLLSRLRLGETVMLTSTEGNPLALLVALKPEPPAAKEIADWDARWDALAHQVSLAWKSDKSAAEILSEMRR
jgi:antitoxin (DNA-binding transcriptional repressor) of toxin-antitoxin stability system